MNRFFSGMPRRSENSFCLRRSVARRNCGSQTRRRSCSPWSYAGSPAYPSSCPAACCSACRGTDPVSAPCTERLILRLQAFPLCLPAPPTHPLQFFPPWQNLPHKFRSPPHAADSVFTIIPYLSGKSKRVFNIYRFSDFRLFSAALRLHFAGFARFICISGNKTRGKRRGLQKESQSPGTFLNHQPTAQFILTYSPLCTLSLYSIAEERNLYP